MTEFSPPPQQPRSPDQSPQTPTKAADGFLSKWGYKITTVGSGLSTLINAGLSIEQLASGRTTYGLLMLIPTTIFAVSTGMSAVLAKRRAQGKL